MAEFGSLSPDWINSAYQQSFGRDADQGGAQFWLTSGMDQDAISRALAASDEGRNYGASQASKLGLSPEWADMLKGYGAEQMQQQVPEDTLAQIRTDLSPLLSQPGVIDRLARMAYVESTLASQLGKESPELMSQGEQAVINSALNRWMTNGKQIPNTQRFSTDMMGILNGTDYNGLLQQYQGAGVPEKLNQFKAGNADYDRLTQMIQDRLSGKLGDNINGATHYLNKGVASPGWAKVFGNQQQIGAHTFMNQIPQDWYSPQNLPSWFQQKTQPAQPREQAPPNTFMGSLDDQPQIAPAAFDGLRSLPDQGFTNPAVYQSAIDMPLTSIGGYNGLNSPLINAGYTAPGGYSSGVSPTTRPDTANPFPTTAFAGSGITPSIPVLPQNNTPIFGGSSTTPGTDFWGSLSPTFNFAGGDYLGF